MRERRVNVFRGKEAQKRVAQRGKVAVRRRSRLVRVVLRMERDEGRVGARLLYGCSRVGERLRKTYPMRKRRERGRVRRLEARPCLRNEEGGCGLGLGGGRGPASDRLGRREGF